MRELPNPELDSVVSEPSESPWAATPNEDKSRMSPRSTDWSSRRLRPAIRKSFDCNSIDFFAISLRLNLQSIELNQADWNIRPEQRARGSDLGFV